MDRLLIFVEGPTEESFVNHVLRPHLEPRGIQPIPQTLGKTRKEAGVPPYDRFMKEVLTAIDVGKFRFYTTMLDYYGLPRDYPGRANPVGVTPSQLAGHVETAIKEDIYLKLPATFREDRFFPHLQMHEFEAMLYSDPFSLAKTLMAPGIEADFKTILDECGEPEAIDDSPVTAPSKRIKKLVPSYQKVQDGLLAAKRITLETIRGKCPHFNQWLTKIESL